MLAALSRALSSRGRDFPLISLRISLLAHLAQKGASLPGNRSLRVLLPGRGAPSIYPNLHVDLLFLFDVKAYSIDLIYVRLEVDRLNNSY